jgi:putative NIF3 family GTP cyclohydrolase 1 type 2
MMPSYALHSVLAPTHPLTPSVQSYPVDRDERGPLTLLSPHSSDLVHDAYRRLTYQQLHLFCSMRSLSTTGTQVQLACRLAHYDLRLYAKHASVDCHPNGNDTEPADLHFDPSPNVYSCVYQLNASSLQIVAPSSADYFCQTQPMRLNSSTQTTSASRTRASHIPPLPVEIMAEILEQVGDWELAKAVGLPTSIQEPRSWEQASATDRALLTGRLPLLVSCEPTLQPPTPLGARLIVRFSYINILDYLFHHCRPVFGEIFDCHLIPKTAALHGRVDALNWWQTMHEKYPEDFPAPDPHAIAEAIDGASRTGHVESLDWWLESGLPFEYTEAALEQASSKNQLDVLEWWREQRTRLPLKVGRVMDTASAQGHVPALAWWTHSGLDYTYDRQALYHASCNGHIDVLQWWVNSGLQLFFDQDVLVGATRYDRAEVLHWWDKSGLPVQYRMCDIEEALEDVIGGGGERARKWWKGKGVDFNADDKEWMKLQNLN